MSAFARQRDWRSVVQTVTATAGFAYGVIGADIHVQGDGTPLYVLENYSCPAVIDPNWLRELPSRMLSARFTVVRFTGRESEQDQLRNWSQTGLRLAARWLHAPGGQGKTRLAARVAEELIDAGWKVVTVTHGPGAILPPPGSQDMRLGKAPGLLLIIDYADRWPLAHLTQLFSNALLHQSATPTRVLLLARSADAWSGVCHELGKHQAGTSRQFLESLPDDPEQRTGAFIIARDSFAKQYGMLDPSVVVSPAQLNQPDYGLTLTLHMAALVAVDAHVHGRRLPQDTFGLTSYLLTRERAHWTHLYENRAEGLEFQTPPSVMSRAVFTAALSGPVNQLVGKTILDGLDLQLHSEQILTDHSTCYPPVDPKRPTVLEPLYPDRLAEDFLGVTMPGHDTDQPAQAWARVTAATLLSRSADQTPAAYTPRAITFLASATERWPNLGETFLYPLLRRDPQLAVDAGSAALTTLAAVDQIAMDVLEAIERRFPAERERNVDLDVGMAAVVRRLTDHRLAMTEEPGERAQLQFNLGLRFSNAGDDQQALKATEDAVEIYRTLAAAESQAFEPHLASALNNLGATLGLLGRHKEALSATEEAVNIRRRLAAAGDPEALALLPGNLDNLGHQLSSLGHPEKALPVTSDAVEVYRLLAASAPEVFEPDLAIALDTLGLIFSLLGRHGEAVRAAQEGVDIRRRLASADPHAFEPERATSLIDLSLHLHNLGNNEEAVKAAQEGVDISGRLARVNPQAFEPQLASSLGNLSISLAGLGREDGFEPAKQAVEIFRRLAAVNPAAFEHHLAAALNTLAGYLSNLGRHEESLDVALEGVEVYSRLASTNPRVFEEYLAKVMNNLSAFLAHMGQFQQALQPTRDAVDIQRRLAAANPKKAELDLANMLRTFAHVRTMGGAEIREAEAAMAEAKGIYLRRLKHRSATDDLAQIMGVLSDSDLDEVAEAGGPDIMFTLGVVLRHSHPARARRLWQKAADAGQPQAMNNVGAMLVRTDPATARRWLLKAAKVGHREAMYNLGSLLVDSDPLQARQWWQKAARAGDRDAMLDLAALLAESNPAEARKWRKRAAQSK